MLRIPDPSTNIPMLGGLSPQAFMRRHWQKKPLLVRQAFPGVRPPLERDALFELAASESVESRLVQRLEGNGAAGWSVRRGPIAPGTLPALGQLGWTLLVQSVDLHADAACDMLHAFGFISSARLDDLMVSWASPGGGVGPHVDSYDVFLLQVAGKRRWQIGRPVDPALVEGLPLKILRHFEPEDEWLLEPGDMLYLPPGWAHDGIAEGECMTCSIGFRSPSTDEFAYEVLQRTLDAIEPHEGELYRDPKQPPTATPGWIPDEMREFASASIAELLDDAPQLACSLGEWLSEPKPQVVFDEGSPVAPGHGARLDRRSRMLWDHWHVFINGESFRADGRDAALMRRLADRRQLVADEVAELDTEARALLDDWAAAGWLHATS